MKPRLEVSGVWKYYGDFPALRDIAFRVIPGSTVALLGRNGAGKTTLLRILAGLSKPSRGSVTIHGPSVREEATRRRIGVLGHGISLYDELSAVENLQLFAKLYGVANPSQRVGGDAGAYRPGRACATGWCANFRAGCGSGWPWLACFCTIPRCCCWMSRSPRSMTAPSRCCNRC